MANTTTPAKKAAPAKSKKTSQIFSDEELAAMQETKRERKRGSPAEGLADLEAKIAEMKGLDRELAEKIHAIVTRVAPQLAPKTWYGMPAWAGADGKAVCFFTPAGKFKSRYASFGFNEGAKLDDGQMWSTAFAIIKIGPAEEKQIASLVKKAAG